LIGVDYKPRRRNPPTAFSETMGSVIRHPRLENPPIEEVVCGFRFAPVDISPLHLGLYWESRKAKFPKHQVKPVLLDGHSFSVEALPSVRVWLETDDGTIVLQIQKDRFYMNWKRSSAVYPRFSSHGGNDGLKALALSEFTRFTKFVKGVLGLELAVHVVELTKVDLFRRGRDFSSQAELHEILPASSVFAASAEGAGEHLQIVSTRQTGKAITRTLLVTNPQEVRLEVAHVQPVEATFDAAFDIANAEVNAVFFSVVSGWKRFGVTE
jgi:uncharacterized protein (TIGR04255 family)